MSVSAVFEHLGSIAEGAILIAIGGWLLASLVRRRGLHWSWTALVVPVLYALLATSPRGLVAIGVCLLASALGLSWHRADLENGADFAAAAHARLRVHDLLRRHLHRRALRRGGWIKDGRLAVGVDGLGLPVRIPVGYASGSHTLVVGATGTGKTVSQAWIATRLIESGHAAVVIDPKGDRMLRDELAASAARRGGRFIQWTPEGPSAYNPYATGSETEIADKALCGELFTEPHYLRQAQRYLGHAIRTMQAAGVAVTPVTLMAHLDPRELEVIARDIPERQAAEVQRYLDSLTERQKRDLAGVRDRLSILAESDARLWLDPGEEREALEIERALREASVVYFRLDSDRRPLLSSMLAAAIVSDLISLVARLQGDPVASVVLIDEFSAVAAEHTARLFGRARSAGISLILGTQELADLTAAGDALREQTLGNVASVIAHRQNVPESAELIASIGATKPVWVTTQQTEGRLLGSVHSGRGSRRRGHEFAIHPTQIKQLRTGQAVVLTPGSGRPLIAQMHHPSEARVGAAGMRSLLWRASSSLRELGRRLAATARPRRARCARSLRSPRHPLERHKTTTPPRRRNL
jgi:Type IV secretion-system coupling protein DNA-binding domain